MVHERAVTQWSGRGQVCPKSGAGFRAFTSRGIDLAAHYGAARPGISAFTVTDSVRLSNAPHRVPRHQWHRIGI
jgi:hypothetical protein